MANERKKGFIGQLRGPFNANTNLINLIQPNGCKLKLGISVDPYDLMAQDIFFQINDETFSMGKTAMYEMDSPMMISNFYFVRAVPASTIVEYVFY